MKRNYHIIIIDYAHAELRLALHKLTYINLHTYINYLKKILNIFPKLMKKIQSCSMYPVLSGCGHTV